MSLRTTIPGSGAIARPLLSDKLVYIPLGKILSPLEDPIGIYRPLMRDYSWWSGYVDMSVALENNIRGMFSRVGIGRYYADSTFPVNYSNAKVYGLYRSSYHVLNPTQSVITQADDIWFKYHSERDVVPRMLDLESSYGATASQIADATWDMSELVLSRDGVRPIIYSRYGLINPWLVPFWTPDMLNVHYYVLAQYMLDHVTEHPGPPTLPTGVLRDRIVAQQTADKKADFPGECSGSSTADWDRWELGNSEEMNSWIEVTWGGGGNEEMSIYVKVIAPLGMNQRTSPEVLVNPSNDIGDLLFGCKMSWFETRTKDDNSVWYRISKTNTPDPEVWVCGKTSAGSILAILVTE